MNSTCKTDNCGKRAWYGYIQQNPIACSSHRIKPEMFNVVIKKCKCGKAQPIFGLVTDTKATCCSKCMTNEMVNIKDKKCKCGKSQPTYGLPTDTKATCCSKCMTDTMINLKDKKCICDSAIARYGFEKDNKIICCVKCCKDGMIDLKNKNRTNCYCECGKWASFGIIGKQPVACFTCKTDTMVDLRHAKCACGNRAKWGVIFNKLTHCSDCKTDNMINPEKENSKCKANEQNIICEIYGNPKYNGYCTHCFIHLFPNDPLAKNVHQKTKEIVVKNYINDNFTGFSHDKTLWIDNCKCTHRRRIDHRKLIGNTLLCIETDENQHKYYKEYDEKIRYDDVMMIHGGKFIFIRFNPPKALKARSQSEHI